MSEFKTCSVTYLERLERESYQQGFEDGKREATPKWLPISEAPKDKTILVSDGKVLGMAEWQQYKGRWVDPYEGYYSPLGNGNSPTHFMLLLALPKDKS